jgi:hypothetical protein
MQKERERDLSERKKHDETGEREKKILRHTERERQRGEKDREGERERMTLREVTFSSLLKLRYSREVDFDMQKLQNFNLHEVE